MRTATVLAAMAAGLLYVPSGPAPGRAQEAEAAPAPPACTTEATPYRDFDFWVGEWEVYDRDGVLAGENAVTLRENGCLIVEEWTGAGGGVGLSMNFYDPAQGAWRQVWRSPGVLIDYAGGLDEGGAMFLEGSITYDANSRTAPFRGKWTAQDDGSVLQEFWEQNSETGEWDVWFVGEYRRKEE